MKGRKARATQLVFPATSIAKYTESEKLINIYEEMRARASFKRQEATRLRNFLVADICLSNARRAGDMGNMTEAQFDQGKWGKVMPEGGDVLVDVYSINVLVHKTSEKHECVIQLNPRLYQQALLHWKTYCKPMLCDKSEFVLVSTSPKKNGAEEVIVGDTFLRPRWD